VPPFDIARFNALLETETFGRTLMFEPTVGSTMDLARDAARHGSPHGTLALADEQTAGRGRLGRSWVTPPALNLTSTLLLRPPAALLRTIAMMAPLAVVDTLEPDGVRCDLKWPNDVQVAGKKISGVLIETELDGATPCALVGVGINVNFDPRTHDDVRDVATSLLVETQREHDREALLARYLGAFERVYAEGLEGGAVRKRWRSRLATIGQQVTATWPGGSASGIAEDVTDDGALLLRLDDGAACTVEAGDVTLRAR
jgi:BirA family biotin operon repressor/biotin-[acetyl-CoA-carboxylase] ligase